MRIRISSGLKVSLLDQDDFKRFDVYVEVPATRLNDVGAALYDVAELEGSEVAWVRRDWIVKAVDKPTEEWRNGFAKMIAYASDHGWVRHSPSQIRAHLVWPPHDAPGSPT